ncbi:MAG: FAD:protein FMN transferase [Deltaproteobacteria bacterium]|jgi:FAD:protein FMN transferase|nr:FAD:protein FMN transferase [Deltaproteobacteria bacterium]
MILVRKCRHKKIILSGVLSRAICLMLALLLSSCLKNPDTTGPVVYTGATMGTTYSIKVSGFSDSSAIKQVQQEIEKLLQEINLSMSTYRADSEISRFNRFADVSLFPISRQMALVVKESLRVSTLTEGALDITVAPLVNLWGFGTDKQTATVVDEKKINALKRRIGYKKIKVETEPPLISKQHPELTIDLSAVAKGFAVDQVGMLLENKGLNNYLVEIGGEIRTKGFKQHQTPWVVAIERPVMGQSVIQQVLSMGNNSLATSGDYRNYFEKNGKRFSHLIDPNTGKPINHRLASASVVHQSCMTADAFATAFMITGFEKGYQLALQENLAAFFLIRTQSGFDVKMTPAFESFIISN